MKKIISFLITISLISCKEDEPLPLTPDLVSRVKAFDLDNNGDASDIRVDFSVINNQDVREYRVMILPAKDSSLFTLNDATSNTSYYRIDPVSFQLDYSVNRLPAGFLDVNGATIINDIVYVSVVLVEKNGEFQLSGFSFPFTLKTQGIYNGHYWIGRETNCVYYYVSPGSLIPVEIPTVLPNGSVFVNLNSNIDRYFGLSQCEDIKSPNSNQPTQIDCEDSNLEGSLEFTIIGMQVENFTLKLLSGTCPVYISGNGVIEDETRIIVTAIAERCADNCNETWTFVRQY